MYHKLWFTSGIIYGYYKDDSENWFILIVLCLFIIYIIWLLC